MQIAFVSVPQFWSYLRGHFISADCYSPMAKERLGEISSRHVISAFPSQNDIAWGLDRLVLSSDFYDQCRHRIERSTGKQIGDEAAVMAGIACEGAQTLIERMKARLKTSSRDRGFSRALLEVFAGWKRLETIIEAAFPGAAGLLTTPNSPTAFSVSSLAARREELWDLGQLLYPPDYLDRIADLEPRIVFLCGNYPDQLAGAVMLACQIRKKIPGTRLILWPSEQEIGFISLAHLRDTLLRTPSFFEVFNGVPLYVDLLDLTFCDIIQRMTDDGSDFHGLENVAYWRDGSIHFTDPSPERVHNYLGELNLASFWTEVLPDAPVRNNSLKPPLTIAKIIPAKQNCYWKRCHFCAINVPSYVQHDPFPERRCAETVSLFSHLADTGVDFLFLGHEVVAPSVLKGIVSPLKSLRSRPDWAFEGKFEHFYTPEFIKSLSEAGCRGAIFGLESSSDRINQLMNKHGIGMNITEIGRIIDDFDNAGISVHINTIYNFPGTTRGEFREYKKWIRKAFNSHRFLHFNTNGFLVFPGSDIARDPAAFGVETEMLPDHEFFIRAPLRTQSMDLPGNADTIWEYVFGAAAYQGCSLEQLHEVYHEQSMATFWDASHGYNLFKIIQSQLTDGHILDAVLRIADNVEIVESDMEAQWIWLIDIGGLGGWIRLSRDHWRVFEMCIKNGRTLREVLNDIPSKRMASKYLYEAKFLLFSGFLQPNT